MKTPASKPLFVPVLPRPGGDRFVSLAVFEALREMKDAAVADPVEAYDENGELKPLETIARAIDDVVQAAASTSPHHAVAFYTGRVLVAHLKPLLMRKFATTHLHPLELYEAVTGETYDSQSWNSHSLQQEFGLDLLACPAHMAVYDDHGRDTSHDVNINDDANVIWTFGVSSQQAPVDPDLSGDPDFANAHVRPLFVISLSTPDAPTDKDMVDMMAHLIQHEEKLGKREIIIVDNPRSGHLKDMLLDALGRDYTVISELGAFTARVLPAVKKHPQSKIFLPGDSASVMTETIEALPWHYIIVNGTVIKDHEQRKMVPQFFERGRIQILNGDNVIVKPSQPNNDTLYAAGDVARAALTKFTT